MVRAAKPSGNPAARVRRAPTEKPLYQGRDHGHPILVRQSDFATPSRTGGWGTFAESFIRFNEHALRELDVAVDLVPGSPEPTIRLIPGGNAGAVPLRSAQTSSVVAGLVVVPRFGWSGVGSVMSETGWTATPNFLNEPLVPGSARQVPPWVLAGPVLFRLQALLQSIAPGYSYRSETRTSPRGRVMWRDYLANSFVHGTWHRIPCCFPDLGCDPQLRAFIRWAVERIKGELVGVGGREPLATALVGTAGRLLEELADVLPVRPNARQLEREEATRRILNRVLQQGLQALGWVADERGLGGGREMDGLSWQLPLEILWERYVEANVRHEVAREGGEVTVGRLGQTVFPLHWSTSAARSVTHLVPDIVVRRGRSVNVVDAKYKAHFAELDERDWIKLSHDVRESHRSDIHQALAYASLYDAEEITATLVYPLRAGTWESLKERGRDRARAELFHANRRVNLELRGLPFGSSRAS